jgi:hypothetical protein
MVGDTAQVEAGTDAGGLEVQDARLLLVMSQQAAVIPEETAERTPIARSSRIW